MLEQRILGQEHALDTLRRALRGGRFHHAWIFSGPRGVGKFTTAREIARILLDPGAGPNLAGAIEADPAGRTSHLIDAGTHPDLRVIRKELARDSDVRGLEARKLINIPIDLLREHMIGGKTGDDRLREAPAYRKPMLGHGKVFIIDEAELIDVNGQNALLKTLEEPPPRTYIVLVTARAERLLPTIHSRCQHVRFGPLAPAPLATCLDRLGLDPDGADRAWIERFCEGSPGLALLAAEYGFADWQRTLEPFIAELDAGRFPAAMGAAMADLVAGFAEAWVKANRNASKDAANKDGARHLFALLALHARTRLAPGAADHAGVARALALVDLIREAETHVAANVNLKHALENLVVQWVRLAEDPEKVSGTFLLGTT